MTRQILNLKIVTDSSRILSKLLIYGEEILCKYKIEIILKRNNTNVVFFM